METFKNKQIIISFFPQLVVVKMSQPHICIRDTDHDSGGGDTYVPRRDEIYVVLKNDKTCHH